MPLILSSPLKTAKVLVLFPPAFVLKNFWSGLASILIYKVADVVKFSNILITLSYIKEMIPFVRYLIILSIINHNIINFMNVTWMILRQIILDMQ